MTDLNLSPIIGKIEAVIKYGHEADRQKYLIEIHRE